MIQNAVGDPVDLSVHEHEAVATKLLAFESGIIKKMPDMRVLEDKYDVEIYHHMTEGMAVNEYHTNLDGCGYIVAKGKTVNEAESKALKVLEILSAASVGGHTRSRSAVMPSISSLPIF